jgi:putative endonuclease
MFFVYILFSKKLNRFYIGTTDDVERRLMEHNSRLYANSFTAKGIPWELTLSYSCQSSEIAYKLERFIKKMKSKKFIILLIDNEKIIDDIVLKL